MNFSPQRQYSYFQPNTSHQEFLELKSFVHSQSTVIQELQQQVVSQNRKINHLVQAVNFLTQRANDTVTCQPKNVHTVAGDASDIKNVIIESVQTSVTVHPENEDAPAAAISSSSGEHWIICLGERRYAFLLDTFANFEKSTTLSNILKKTCVPQDDYIKAKVRDFHRPRILLTPFGLQKMINFFKSNPQKYNLVQHVLPSWQQLLSELI
jgi:hypothetical protein